MSGRSLGQVHTAFWNMRQETAGARVRCVIRPQISQEHPIPNSSLSTLIAANARRWALARQLTTKSVAFQAAARRLVAARVRYQNVTQATGVPWHVIAVIHEREASQRWDASIAQGDPWARVSTHVPKGRGPFASWDAAAIDALRNCAPFAAQRRDWSVGGTLTLLEQYNGLGYAHRNQPSPYIWAGTDQYARGKYVADGHYDPAVVDTQLGCAGLLLAMADIDAAVAEALGKTALIVAKPSPSTLPPLPPLPSVVTPQPSSVKPLPPQSWLWRAALRLVTTFFKTS